MKTISLGVLLAVVACSSSPKPEPATGSGDENAAPGAGDDPRATGNSDENAAAPREAGGYVEVAPDREDIVATAERAVELLRSRTGDDSLTLQRIVRGETQVVAGKNTRLTLVLSGQGGERTAKVTVFRNLEGAESLTSVEGI